MWIKEFTLLLPAPGQAGSSLGCLPFALCTAGTAGKPHDTERVTDDHVALRKIWKMTPKFIR